MAKIVVIDSLARSGTTLLTALLHSQRDVAAYRGVFHEPLGCQLGRWAKDYICRSAIDPQCRVSLSNVNVQNQPVPIDRSPQTLTLSWPLIVQKSRQTIEKNQQYAHLSPEEWDSFFLDEPSSMSDLDAAYQRLAQRMGVDVLCFRWNQALPYIDQWFRNSNHFWISIVRNPLSRAASHRKSHGIDWDESLEYSRSFAKLTSAVVERAMPRYHLLHYEDLVSAPETELDRMLRFLDHSVDSLNTASIRGQDGRQYRSETVDNIGERGSHKSGVPTKGFYGHAIDRYKTEMPAEVVDRYSHALRDERIYRRYFASEK